MLLLGARAAAERNVTAARDRVAADILLSFDQDYRGSRFSRNDRGGKPRRTRADDDDIGLAIPPVGICGAWADAGLTEAPLAAAAPPEIRRVRLLRAIGIPRCLAKVCRNQVPASSAS